MIEFIIILGMGFAIILLMLGILGIGKTRWVNGFDTGLGLGLILYWINVIITGG